ncbi:MAG TPA: hypothetical protein VME40_17955 [Caulobacteraceae bacterium]|nr:hypothetical protein [Caulobacteraceae bacterium]
MSASHLVVLPSTDRESPAARIRRLQDEARELAHQQLDLLNAALVEVGRLSTEIAEGGDLYPVGARELARRLIEESAKQAFSLSAIIERS